jgi:metal-responsive CopG/Arc/MetJ family transcriptional regulator
MERERKIKYTTVHIPSVLAGLIDDILEREEFAYSSRSEFIKDAIRRFLEYYGYYPRKKTSFKRYEEYPELPRHIEVATPRPNEDSTKQL